MWDDRWQKGEGVATSTNLVVLILGLGFLLVVLVLGVLVLRGRDGSSVEGGFEAVGIKTSIKVTREQREQVGVHLEQAVERTGLTAGVSEAQNRLEATRLVERKTVLWIDDNPDNNIEENLMLRDLGLSITQTLSTEGARRYVDRASFDLVITDIGRRHDREAGLKDIEELRANDRDRPILVYTFDAGERGEKARSRGAESVSETPAELLEAVLRHVAA